MKKFVVTLPPCHMSSSIYTQSKKVNGRRQQEAAKVPRYSVSASGVSKQRSEAPSRTSHRRRQRCRQSQAVPQERHLAAARRRQAAGRGSWAGEKGRHERESKI